MDLYQEAVTAASVAEPRRCSACCDTFCYFVRKCLTFLLSHVGLVALVVGYCLAGAVVFEKLEKQNELKVKDDVRWLRQQLTEDIWTHTEELRTLKEDDWMRGAEKLLKDFEISLVHAMRKDGWNGHESHSKTQWTFSGSLFYAIICITTIGYGDQTPKTSSGKLMTIAYALCGIPLMVVCLSNTGNAMAHSFKFLYWRVCCFLCLAPAAGAGSHAGAGRRRGRRGSSVQSGAVTGLSRVRSTRSLPVSAHHPQHRRLRRTMSMRSQSSVGTGGGGGGGGGGRTPMTPRGRHPHLWRFDSLGVLPSEEPVPIVQDQQPGFHPVGLPNPSGPTAGLPLGPGLGPGGLPVAIALRATTDRQEEEEEANRGDGCVINLGIDRDSEQRDSKRSQKSDKSAKSLSLNLTATEKRYSPDPYQSYPVARFLQQQQQHPSRSAGSNRSSAKTEEGEEFNDYSPLEVEYSEEEFLIKEVPLWICGVLVLSYILLGAVLFSDWEQWSFLDSAYFCFITLATIGFGDFVPKANRQLDGDEQDGEQVQISIVICSVYLLFGMSLLVMTLNLIKEQVTNCVRNIAFRLGILGLEDLEFD